MKKIPQKYRVGIGVALVLISLVCVLATIICASYHAQIWILIVIPVFAVFAFVLGIVFVPKTNENGTPIEKKLVNKKQKRHKSKIIKKPFITNKEWKNEEEEEDEMVFIDEVVEDD